MTLLVGFGLDRDDRSGLEYAATLARSSGQDLLVVTVVPAPWPTPIGHGSDREFEEWARDAGRAAVHEAETVLAEQCPEVSARAIAVPGRSIPATLLQQADVHKAAMIVLGSGHDGHYGHVHLSSTSDRLLHSSHVPVAIATRGYLASDHGRVTRVTCAFRGDEVSWSTLTRTAEICRDVGAGLRIATFAVRGRTMYPPEVGTRSEDMVLERWVEQSEAMQAEALAGLEERGTVPDPTDTVVVAGRSWAHALDRLEWERDELLVIGSSISAGVLSRLFLGSSASKILRHAPVPVIVVP